jgi:Tfp pilus assembly protein PilF
VALAALYVESGRIDEGERQLRTALDNSPDDPEANRAYASLLVAADRCEDAERYWLKVAAESSDDSGTLSLADYYVYSGRPDDAKRTLARLTTGRDEHGAARLRIAAIDYDRGNRTAAERLVDQVLTLDTQNLTALVLKGRLALERGDRATTLEYAKRAARVSPEAPEVQSLLTAAQGKTP